MPYPLAGEAGIIQKFPILDTCFIDMLLSFFQLLF